MLVARRVAAAQQRRPLPIAVTERREPIGGLGERMVACRVASSVPTQASAWPRASIARASAIS